MKIREIRRQNLALLIKSHANNSQREFSELIGKPASLVSQMINDTRGMGEKVARAIESSLSVEPYSLDKPSATPAVEIGETKPEYLPKRSAAVLRRLHKLAEAGSLTEEDFRLIDQLVDRFQGKKVKGGR